jgi:hypothetical protein
VNSPVTIQQPGAVPRGDAGTRVLLPVPGLDVASTWHVGPVIFHPAGAARELIDAIPQEDWPPDHPVFREWLEGRVSALSASAVAELSVTGADNAEATAAAVDLVESALAIMRAVQHMRNPMNAMDHQTFGLPGDVRSAILDYIVSGKTTTIGASRSGALAGWTFSDADRRAWQTDPAFRFLDQALNSPESDRTILQGRALLTIACLAKAGCPTSPTSNCSPQPWLLRSCSVRRPTRTKSSGSHAGSLISPAAGPASFTPAQAGQLASFCRCL